MSSEDLWVMIDIIVTYLVATIAVIFGLLLVMQGNHYEAHHFITLTVLILILGTLKFIARRLDKNAT